MSASIMHGAERDPLSAERRHAALVELERILESASFRGSKRCSRLLEYSVQQVLKGAAPEGLKERTVGIEAFDRPADYDTSEDAVVRVTANEVRKRLAQYYQSPASPPNPTIALSAGSYAVTFQWPAATVAEGQLSPAVSDPLAVPVPHVEPARAGRMWALASLAAAILLAVAVVAFWRRPAAPPTHPADAFWSQVFHARQKTNIVLSDAVYRQVQFFLGRDLSLGEYLAPGYPAALAKGASPDVRRTLEFLSRQQSTSVGSATLASRLAAFGSKLGGEAAIRYPRHLNAREFNTDSFILLGSRLSIPWEEMFEQRLNFPLATDPATHRFYLRNMTPQTGEPAEYRESADQTETYADIALLPNLSGTGAVLILNGIDMVAAEAAGDFAMNGGLAATRGNFEALVRIRAVGGAVEKTEIVTLRKLR